MASLELSARLKHLNDSAHLLATSAPATSAYLMSRCNDLMFENEIEQPEARRRHICGACGNIMVLGWTGTIEIESKNTRKRKRDQSTNRNTSIPASPTITITCDRCSRVTKQEITAPKPEGSRNQNKRSRAAVTQGTGQPSTLSGQLTSQIENSSIGSTKSSRKKRGTWKQNSLQAMLAKSKENDAKARTGGGFGLDLMDLMKKA